MTKKEQVIQDIRDRKLAIENDNLAKTEVCLKYFWPEDNTFETSQKFQQEKYFYQMFGDCAEWVSRRFDLPVDISQSIPATELLKILEGEWMPEMGEMVEVSDNEVDWYKRKFLTKVNHEYAFIAIEGGFPMGFKFCRPIQKKQITVSELFEKAGLNEREWEVVG